MLDLTKDNFEAEVLQADGTVFVDYYGDGCIPCAELMPFVHEKMCIRDRVITDEQLAQAMDILEEACDVVLD